uniref:WH1 domain-containing protein n=1 Tax=Panagrolaimus sp. JU765 TaxID=591449 RepID=A0AC34RLL5_9BILA
MRQLAAATVDVLYYQSGTKSWIKPEGSSVESKSTEGRANLFLIQEYSAGYRIVAQRVTDNQPLLDQIIYKNFFYKVTQPTFHQWKSESKQVFGLIFINPDEAEEFSNIVQKAVLDVNSSINNNGGNIYQDPQLYGQQQQIYEKEPDSESIGSAGQMNYQQSQQTLYVK